MDARISWSASERLRAMDFEQMSAAEIREAARAVRSLSLPVKPVPTRRSVASPAGRRPDLRATLRRSLRRGGEVERIEMRKRRTRPPDLVALCDISGSMSVYSRMLMHFLHAVTWAPERGWGRVSAFTFGTRLTNVTRALAQKDPDARARRRGPRRAGLGGRHAHRRGAPPLQRRLVAAGAGAGGGRPPHHRRARAGRHRDAGARDRTAPALLPAAHLAQSAPPLGRLRAEGRRHPRDPAACGQLPRLPFARQPRRPLGGAVAVK
jgi:hypothetical protein